MSPKLAANITRIMGWGFLIFGVIFVSIAFAGYDGFAHRIADWLDWTHVHDEVLTRDARWFGAIFAGVMAGFGAIYALVIAPLLTVQNEQARQIARRGGLIAAFTWYVVDSAGSFAAGVPSNVAMNTLFLILITAPLFMVRFKDH